ncbi:MAG: phosphoribosylglycinamide formyltransferase [Erysipelotrichaceae bacterium]
MVRIAIFASGSGTNFENIIQHINNEDIPNGLCATLICDNNKAYAIERAKRLSIPCHVVNFKDYPNKQAYESEVLKVLKECNVDLIVLAGYMRIISPLLLSAYKHRIINLHPAYLPQFPGKQSILDAYEAKVKTTGVTVHYIDEGIDTGEIIHQEKIQIDPTWSLETLEEHVHALEYKMFPKVIKKVCKLIEEELS